MRLMILTGSLLLALGTQVVAGTIYRWVDEQGVTHFSAQPPRERAAETLRMAVPPTPPTAAPATPRAPQSAAEQQREIEQKVKREIAEAETERQRYCTTLRTQLVQLENNPRVRVQDAGQVRRLTEEERQARILETRKKLTEDCD